MGRGRGRGRGDDRNGGFGDRGPPGGGRFGQFGGGEETTFSVPSEKCGLVIGKGETLNCWKDENCLHTLEPSFSITS